MLLYVGVVGRGRRWAGGCKAFWCGGDNAFEVPIWMHTEMASTWHCINIHVQKTHTATQWMAQHQHKMFTAKCIYARLVRLWSSNVRQWTIHFLFALCGVYFARWRLAVTIGSRCMMSMLRCHTAKLLRFQLRALAFSNGANWNIDQKWFRIDGKEHHSYMIDILKQLHRIFWFSFWQSIKIKIE